MRGVVPIRVRLRRFGGWLLSMAWVAWALGGPLVTPSLWLWFATVFGPMIVVFFVILWDSTGDNYDD